MAFWQVIIIISAISTIFVLWPLVKAPFAHRSWKVRVNQDQTQVDLYQEHVADMAASLQRGDIDQQQFDQLKLDLQKTLVAESQQGIEKQERKTGGKSVLLGAALLIPVLSLVLYSQWGAKTDWDIYQHLEKLPKAENQADYNALIRELVVMVQARLNQTPDNIQLQSLLAQTAMTLQDYDQAVSAYRSILDAFPESPRIMSNLAQALFYRAGNAVTPEVRDYVHKTLALAPMLPEMLGLAGIDAKNQGDLRGAISYWKRAVQSMDPKSRTAQGYLGGIAKAEQALIAAGESLDEPKVDAAADTGVELNISLTDKAQVSGDDTLFVYARAWQGPKMPLAIQKLKVADLPLTVTLTEAMAMAPGMTIKSFEQLELVARISKSGSPAAQSGDWQGAVGPVSLNSITGPIDINIDQQIP